MPRSSYYKRPSEASRIEREQSRATLRGQIEEVLRRCPAYGYRKVTWDLARQGVVANHKRVAKLMREEALTPRRVRKYLCTTDSDHVLPVLPNLAAGLVPTERDQLWVADITYIRLAREFVFLSVILDVWSRKVVGYASGKTLGTPLTLAALESAAAARRPGPGLIHHSDRGTQYAAREYRERLDQLGIRGSMGRKGNPYDNAYAESFFKTLKYEEIYMNEYKTMKDVSERLPFFLEQVYNRRRLHSSLGYVPPEEYDVKYTRREGVSSGVQLST
jgi:putative transposase